MNLNDNQIAKIDPLLEEVLMGARGDEVIRTIVSLGAENKIKKDASHPPLEPKQFSSNEAYRQALIDRRKSQVTEEVGGTIQALQNLSLKTLGEGLSRVVVVEGSADAIVRSLELPGVNHVTLDQLIALPEIAPEQAVKHFAYLYIKTLERSLDHKTTKLISQASQQYIINYYKRHNKLQILGMQKPVDLDSIYTAVQCLPPSDMGQFESVEALQELFRQAGRGFQPRETDKQDGIAVANQQQYLMVLGVPGAGKSTFLRKIGLEALKGKGNQSEFPHECIPVFIELKQFTDEINIEETIREEFGLCQLPFAEEFTTKALQQGKLLILLDGLDEVPTNNMDLAILQIQNFVDKYQKNRFITSCRTAAYRRNFRQFQEVAIADFDDTQIHTFIQNWFSSEVDRKAGTAEKCWKLINTQESTKELARTPLLLTFLCLVYDASQDLPKKLAPLYSKALDILLEKWAAEKRLPGDQIYRDLGIDLEKIMLSEIAYLSFEADKLFVSQQEIVSQIKEFIASNDNAPKHLETEAILYAIAIQQGILVERARNVYSFSHLTLQEYLTAKYIDDHHLVEKLVSEHLTDERWKEVFLLVSGLMRGGADELLLLMEKEAQKYINTLKLQALLRWADHATAGSEGNFKLVGKRAAAIAYTNANAIATKAAEILAAQQSIGEQLVECVQTVLPNWGTEDLLVLARPFAYAMRSSESQNAASALKNLQNSEWTALSEVEKAKVTLAIASYAFNELNKSEYEA